MIVYWLSIVAIIVTAVTILYSSRRPVFINFAGFSFSLALWLACQYFIDNSHDVHIWLGVALIMIATVVGFFVHFCATFPDRSAIAQNLRLLPFLTLIALGPLSFSSLMIKVDSDGIVSYGPLYRVQTAMLILTLFIGIGLLAVRYVRGAQDVRAQIRLLLFAFIPFLVISYLTGVTFVENAQIQVIRPIGALIMALIIMYAIVKHSLFDIRSFVFRAISYSFTTVLLGIAYVAPVIYLLSLIFGIPFSLGKFVAITLLATATAANYHRLQLWFNRVTQKIFFREAYDPAEMMAELNRTLLSTIELKKILSLTSSIVEKHLNVEFCAFMMPSGTDQTMRVIGKEKFSLNKDDEPIVIAFLQDLRKDRLDVRQLPDVETGVKRILTDAEVAVVNRLSVNKIGTVKTVAYMFIGVKKSGKLSPEQDYQLLDAVASVVAMAMQNALHYEEVQQFNETLQARVEEATRKLRVTNDKLKKMDETKDEFISMASHQLRTPLTSVKGYVSMVLDGDVGPINPQQRELLGQSFASSQRMANLISDLLNLSRINTGKFVIELTPVYLPQIIEAELGQLREMAEGKHIELKLDLPVAFPKLMLDDNKMHQVIMNLIDNALYYTPEGGKVTVSLRETPETVEFRVVDTGIGVPRDSQRHLFSKMYRAENARRARPDGTGLGLFMVKKVVVEQQGAIIFESEENKGSTFGFRFNKKDHEVPAEDTETNPTERASVTA